MYLEWLFVIEKRTCGLVVCLQFIRARASISQDYWGGHKTRLGVWEPQWGPGAEPNPNPNPNPSPPEAEAFCETIHNICV